MMQRIIVLLIFLLGTTFSLKAQSEKSARHQVVIQLSTNDTLAWKGLMNNLRNLKEGWGDSVRIEVVAHGPGIEILMQAKTTQLERIRMMRDKGIAFFACENTMREKNIPKDKIIEEAAFVRMGIGHIIMRQEAGWSYIKAGF